MIIKEGKAFPPTASGSGLLLIGIGCIILIFNSSFRFFALFSSLSALIWTFVGLGLIGLGLWFNFAKSEMDTSSLSKGYLTRVVRIGFVAIKSKIYTQKFDAAIIKKITLTYRVSQGIGAGMVINQGEFNDEFVGLFANYKGKLEDVLIIKGSRQLLLRLVQNELKAHTNWRFFEGAIHKDFELKP